MHRSQTHITIKLYIIMKLHHIRSVYGQNHISLMIIAFVYYLQFSRFYFHTSHMADDGIENHPINILFLTIIVLPLKLTSIQPYRVEIPPTKIYTCFFAHHSIIINSVHTNIYIYIYHTQHKIIITPHHRLESQLPKIMSYRYGFTPDFQQTHIFRQLGSRSNRVRRFFLCISYVSDNDDDMRHVECFYVSSILCYRLMLLYMDIY